ncbi:uncharacterized protein ZBAI_01180 [Zygosaccharomyces bailii ISA1307]|nr:uncharacterized protein ZBAI_01180 [Zygosaccharomyces bailii ISA1307]
MCLSVSQQISTHLTIPQLTISKLSQHISGPHRPSQTLNTPTSTSTTSTTSTTLLALLVSLFSALPSSSPASQQVRVSRTGDRTRQLTGKWPTGKWPNAAASSTTCQKL